MLRFPLALIASLGLVALPAHADRLVTKDGRVLACKKARPEAGGYRVVFENGEILLADKALVRSVEIEGDMSDYVPANDDEKQKLAQGYVKYEGKWLSKPAYENVLKTNFEASKKRLEDIAAHTKFGDGWTKETAHFTFRSNTSPELLDYYCELLEAYYALQNQRIGINPTPSMKRTKMQVNVYRSYQDFVKNAPWGPEGAGAGVIGFFTPTGQSLNFFHDYQDPPRSTWVALHECTHLLTFLIDQDYIPQIWLNEGVADYFGSSKVERDKKGKITITPGEIQLDRVLTVQQAIKAGATSTGTAADGSSVKKSEYEGRPDIKLEELFKVARESYKGFEYAHGWAFVYFLNNFENGKYQKTFDKFFKGLYTLENGIPFEIVNYATKSGTGKRVKPEDIRAYLLKKLGLKDTLQLEKDWKKFVAEIPITGPDAHLKRGLQSFYRFDLESALKDLDEAIQAGTKDPRAWWARGQARSFSVLRRKEPKDREEAEKAMEEIQKGFADATEDLHKAVELDPLNASYRYVYSHLLAKVPAMAANGLDGMDVKLEGEERFSDADAKAQAGLAHELDPDNDEFQKWFAKFD